MKELINTYLAVEPGVQLAIKSLNIAPGSEPQEIFRTKLYQALKSATTAEIQESLDIIGSLSLQSSASSLFSDPTIQLRFDAVKALVQKLSDDEVASLSDNTMQNLFKLSLIACDSRNENDDNPTSDFVFLEKLYDRYKDKIDNKFKDYHIALIYSLEVDLPNLLDTGLLYSKNILCNLAKLSGTSISEVSNMNFFTSRAKFKPEQCKDIVIEHLDKKLLIILDGHGIGDVHEMLGQKTTVWVNSFLDAINNARLKHPAEVLLQSCYASNAIKNLKDGSHKTANAKVAALADAPVFMVDCFNTISEMFLDPKITDLNIENFLKVYNSYVKAHLASNPDLAPDDQNSRAKAYNPASIDCTTGEYWTEITKGITLTAQEGKEEITEMNLLGTDDNGHADIDFS